MSQHRRATLRTGLLGRGGAWGFFGLWGLGTLGVLVAMNRAGCEARAGDPARAVQTWSPGWRLRHRLPAEHALTPWIVTQLLSRGPLPGTTEEIELVGRAGALAADLRRAGFVVLPAGVGGEPEPRLEIYGMDGVLRWSGRFRGAEPAAVGAMLLDTVVLQRLARGEAVAPYVPVGCAAVVPAGGRVKDLFSL